MIAYKYSIGKGHAYVSIDLFLFAVYRGFKEKRALQLAFDGSTFQEPWYVTDVSTLVLYVGQYCYGDC